MTAPTIQQATTLRVGSYLYTRFVQVPTSGLHCISCSSEASVSMRNAFQVHGQCNGHLHKPLEQR
eukprot:4971731-Amphidinium_carterae.1